MPSAHVTLSSGSSPTPIPSHRSILKTSSDATLITAFFLICPGNLQLQHAKLYTDLVCCERDVWGMEKWDFNKFPDKWGGYPVYFCFCLPYLLTVAGVMCSGKFAIFQALIIKSPFLPWEPWNSEFLSSSSLWCN